MNIRIGALCAAAFLMAASSVSAQSTVPGPDSAPRVRVTGEASAPAQPDEAILEVGVMTQAKTAQEAATQNAAKVDRVMNVLKKEVGDHGSIRTLNYQLTPDYRNARDDQQATIASYSAYNMIRIRTGELSKVGSLIDLSIEAGANNVQRVEFTVREQNRAYEQALRQATANAMSKAAAMASALKMRVVRVVLLEESGSVVPFRGGRMFDGAETMTTSTTIEPGAVDVRSAVTLTVEVAE